MAALSTLHNRQLQDIAILMHVEDITWWRKDMNFLFEMQNNILGTSAASE